MNIKIGAYKRNVESFVKNATKVVENKEKTTHELYKDGVIDESQMKRTLAMCKEEKDLLNKIGDEVQKESSNFPGIVKKNVAIFNSLEMNQRNDLNDEQNLNKKLGKKDSVKKIESVQKLTDTKNIEKEIEKLEKECYVNKRGGKVTFVGRRRTK